MYSLRVVSTRSLFFTRSPMALSRHRHLPVDWNRSYGWRSLSLLCSFVFVLRSIWPDLPPIEVDFLHFVSLSVSYVPMVFMFFVFPPNVTILVAITLPAPQFSCVF